MHSLLSTTTTLLLLLLAALTSAIDIRFHQGKTCSEYEFTLVCTNAEPRICCNTRHSDWTAVSFSAIPTTWNIMVHTYGGSFCIYKPLQSVETRGAHMTCHPGSLGYVSAGYVFVGDERGSEGSRGNGTLGEREEEGRCVRPDMVYADGGKRYNVSGLGDDEFDELSCYIPEQDCSCGSSEFIPISKD